MHLLQRFNRPELFVLAACVALTGCLVDRTAPPAAVMQFGTHNDSPYGAAMVEPDDTVWKIAQRYRLPVRDIIDLNALTPPYSLAAGQRLKLPAPLEHKVGRSDTLNSLSRMYNVPSSQLVKINNLQPPYALKVGQIVRMPSRASSGAVLATAPMPVEVTPQSAPRRERIETETLSPPTRKPEIIAAQEDPIVPPQPAPARPAEKLVTPVKSQPETPLSTTVLSSARPDFAWPVKGKVISSYGPKDGQLFNDGINIAAPRGAAVAAAADGVIAYVGDDLPGYGNLVLIRHGGGMITAYAHMGSVTVKKGQGIRKGQAIGSVGSTGRVANSQLHFEIRRGTETLDPKKYLG